MAQRAGEKSWEAAISGRRWWNLFLKPGSEINVFLERFDVQPGFFIAASISVHLRRSLSRPLIRSRRWQGCVMPSHHPIRRSICSRSKGAVLERRAARRPGLADSQFPIG
jgi:hypothetical protein